MSLVKRAVIPSNSLYLIEEVVGDAYDPMLSFLVAEHEEAASPIQEEINPWTRVTTYSMRAVDIYYNRGHHRAPRSPNGSRIVTFHTDTPVQLSKLVESCRQNGLSDIFVDKIGFFLPKMPPPSKREFIFSRNKPHPGSALDRICRETRTKYLKRGKTRGRPSEAKYGILEFSQCFSLEGRTVETYEATDLKTQQMIKENIPLCGLVTKTRGERVVYRHGSVEGLDGLYDRYMEEVNKF